MKERNYYYIVSGLPDLEPEHPHLPIYLPDFRSDLESQLHPDDFQWVKWIFLPYDHLNLQNLIQRWETPWHPLGIYSREALEEMLQYPDLLPTYMGRYIDAFKNESPIYSDLSWENHLTQLFFEYTQTHSSTFLREWFQFENYLKNLLTGWNIRHYPYSSQGQYIGTPDTIALMEKANTRDFGLSREIPQLETLLHALEQGDPLNIEKTIDLLKWNYIDELNTFHYFTVEAILGFLLKCTLLYRWQQLDKNQGETAIRSFIKKTETNMQIPVSSAT